MKKLVLAMSILLFIKYSSAQEFNTFHCKDSLLQKKNSTVPIAIGVIGLGCAIEYSRNRALWWTNKYGIHQKLQGSFPNFATRAEDYLRYTPLVIAAGMNINGQKSEHKIVGQIARYATAHLLMDAVVSRTKQYTARLRPDGSEYSSFPSGHTAQAFCTARFLDKEFGNKRPWLRWLGYSMAITTGACRVLNNKHWVTDVLVGAGVGILSVDLTYYVFDRFDKKKNLRVAPIGGKDHYGMSLVYNF